MSKTKFRFAILAVFTVFMVMCFFPVRNSVAGYDWGYDTDNSRDMSNVNNMLAGNYLNDPTYLGEFRWYNPLIHWIETGIVKVSGIPINEIVSKGGTYMNLLAPICFLLMMLALFDEAIAISATAGFLFFINGDIPGWFSATYTAWLYPLAFIQFIFYLCTIALYQAFTKESMKSFIVLGVITGILFLGHTGPAVIMVMQIFWLTIVALLNMIKKKHSLTLSHILKTRMAAAVAFIIVSAPLTLVVMWKYQFKMINPQIYEYADEYFQMDNFKAFVFSNLSVSFFVAVAGLYFLIKSNVNSVVKNIVYSWLFFSVSLFLYVTASKFIRFHYGILLPGIVPSFHFFFYIKAVESVLFGYGFVELITRLYNYIRNNFKQLRFITKLENPQLILITLVAIVIISYPGYAHRGDLTASPPPPTEDYFKDRVVVYQWLISNTNINDVVLCKEHIIAFPLLASGRKMVACTQDHTNPYVKFAPRLKDRDLMLEILNSSVADTDSLFLKYKVAYLFIDNSDSYKNMNNYFPEKVFSCKSYSIYSRVKLNAASKELSSK